MQITKFGHSCLLIEEGGARILIDPGVWSTVPDDLGSLDAILLTHEHPDHTDPARLKKTVAKNPGAILYTNHGVGAVLTAEHIPYSLLEEGADVMVKDVSVRAYGHDHAVIYQAVPCVNTSYLIANKLFCTGDAFVAPGVPVDILALPVVAPWMKMAEAIDFAKLVKPQRAFPVHDAMIKFPGPFHKWPNQELSKVGIEFFIPEEGKPFTA